MNSAFATGMCRTAVKKQAMFTPKVMPGSAAAFTLAHVMRCLRTARMANHTDPAMIDRMQASVSPGVCAFFAIVEPAQKMRIDVMSTNHPASNRLARSRATSRARSIAYWFPERLTSGSM